QVNLVNVAGQDFSFWDGDAGPKFDGVVNGGNGSWDTRGPDNWTDAAGATNSRYAGGAFAVFTGAAGIVTIDNAAGAVTASGMQFATGGYVIDGGTLTLTEPASEIRVGDGTVQGAGYVA